MTWIRHGYDILPKDIPDVVISMSYPWDMTKWGFVNVYGSRFPDVISAHIVLVSARQCQ